MNPAPDYNIVAFELIDQLSHMSNTTDDEEWGNLFKYNVLEIFHLSQWMQFPERGRLAIAITIIGAKSTAHFPLAFNILCNWSFVGGCYWLVQQELLRHAALSVIGRVVIGPEQIHCDTAALEEEINKFLPKELPEQIVHTKTREKLMRLRGDLMWLLNTMDRSTHPYEIYVSYYAQYDLSLFVPWFLQWALPLLQDSKDWYAPILQDVPTAMRKKAEITLQHSHRSGTVDTMCEGKENCAHKPSRDRQSNWKDKWVEGDLDSEHHRARKCQRVIVSPDPNITGIPLKHTPLQEIVQLPPSRHNRSNACCALTVSHVVQGKSPVDSSLSAGSGDGDMNECSDAMNLEEELGDLHFEDQPFVPLPLCSSVIPPNFLPSPIITDPDQLLRMQLQHRKQRKQERIMKENCECREVSAEQSAYVSDSTPAWTLRSASSSQDPDSANIPGTKALMGQFINTLWEMFTPLSQQSSQQMDTDTTPVDVTLETGATNTNIEFNATNMGAMGTAHQPLPIKINGTPSVGKSSADSLVYSASASASSGCFSSLLTTSTEGVLLGKRRLEDEELPWGM